MKAVLGISDHTGWAEFVVVGRVGRTPCLLDRRRVSLVDADLASAPYHHDALRLPLLAAEELVSRVRSSVLKHCRYELADQVSSHGIEAVVIPASPYASLPASLSEILASWQLTCAVDAMMYREMLADCAAEMKLQVERIPRKTDRIAAAAEALRVTNNQIDRLLRTFGETIGAPWRKEHREAAASALAVLGKVTFLTLQPGSDQTSSRR